MSPSALDLFSVSGKTALITGSTQGMGKAMALALLEAGANVLLHGAKPSDHAAATLAEARAINPACDICFTDLSQPDAPEKLLAATHKRGLEIDILVLNAAVQIRKAFNEVTPEDIAWQIQTNFTTNYRLLQLFSPPMLEREWGRIVMIGSVQEQLPNPAFTVYSAMKCAQRNLVESLCHQFGPHGVTINNLAPGVFVTARNEEVLKDPKYQDLILSKIPVRYFAESRDIAGAALLLCSDAGRYLNGATIPVDGGMSLPK